MLEIEIDLAIFPGNATALIYHENVSIKKLIIMLIKIMIIFLKIDYFLFTTKQCCKAKNSEKRLRFPKKYLSNRPNGLYFTISKLFSFNIFSMFLYVNQLLCVLSNNPLLFLGNIPFRKIQ